MAVAEIESQIRSVYGYELAVIAQVLGVPDGDIQDAYAIRLLYEQLADPKYTDKTGIFDIMAVTVIQKGLELAEAS